MLSRAALWLSTGLGDYTDCDRRRNHDRINRKIKKPEMAPATKPESADKVLKHRITELERRLAESQVEESKQPQEYAKAAETNIPKSSTELQPRRRPTAKTACRCWGCDSIALLKGMSYYMPEELNGQYKKRLPRANPVRCQDTVVRTCITSGVLESLLKLLRAWAATSQLSEAC